jgi:invasion protein IalB
MRLLTSIFVAVFMMISAPIQAQESDGTGLDLGQPANGEPREGELYVKEQFGDWNLRCAKRAEGVERCHLYQLMREAAGNPVAEIVFFALAPGQQALAGANILTPLETLLQRQLTISVDGGESRVYPFSFCSQKGCTARVGFTAADILALERGSMAILTIHALASPDTPIEIQLSLKEFIAGYDKLLEGL